MFIIGVESSVKCYEGWSPMSKYVSWKNPESEDCNTDLSDKFKDLESSDVLILHQATITLQNRISKTEGLQQEFFSPSELSHMIKEKEAVRWQPMGDLLFYI